MSKTWKLLGLLGLMLAGLLIGCIPFVVRPASMSMLSTQRWMQLVVTITAFLLPALVFYKRIPMRKGFRTRTFVYILELIIALVPAMNLLTWLCPQLPLPEALRTLADNLQFLLESNMKALMWCGSPLEALWIVFVMAVTPAIAEEFCFRGAIMGVLRGDDESKNSKRIHLLIWCVAIVFSLVHGDVYGFLPRVILGAILGYLLVWTGSIWAPVLFHFLNNALVAVLGIAEVNQEGVWKTLSERAQEIGSADTWWLGVLGFAVAGMLLWSIYKQEVCEH